MTAAAPPVLADSAFLRACRGEAVPHVPVWFMRQAGRSLPEFRAVREKWAFFDVVRSAELTTEVTLQPVRRLGVDAAILFSDIVVPLMAIGLDVEIKPGVGPVFAQPFRGEEDLAALRPLEPDDAPYVTDAVRMLVDQLEVPLIGFAGAPFTVASYLIEGGPSQNYARTKSMMHAEPKLFAALLDALAEVAASFLRLQVAAGASAVQLFDSWAGSLALADYRAHVLPASSRVFDELASAGVPRIHFGRDTGELLGAFSDAGADVVGVDWKVHLDDARTRVGAGKSLQGNLDPAICLAPWPVVADRVRDVLRRGGGSAHVFNLGHGVLPETDPDILKRVVDLVHEETAS